MQGFIHEHGIVVGADIGVPSGDQCSGQVIYLVVPGINNLDIHPVIFVIDVSVYNELMDGQSFCKEADLQALHLKA